MLGTQQIERAAYEEADRDMADLIELKDRISKSWVGSEMTGLGINQRTRHVSVAVRDRKKMAATEAMLKRLSVPSDAVEIVQMSDVQLEESAKVAPRAW